MAMSSMSKTLLFFFVFLLFAAACLAEEHNKINFEGTNKSGSPKIDCGAACAARCRLSSRPRLCKRACGTCCARCNCVPPGTSGNENVCPCYASLTTHGGRHKCP